MSTPTRRIRSNCCALAALGHACRAAEQRHELAAAAHSNAATSAAHRNCGKLWWRSAWAACAARKIGMLPNDVRVVLQLDGLAERERIGGGRGVAKQNCAA